MLPTFIKSQLLKNKTLILHESQGMYNFMSLLMKKRNTGTDSTREDIVVIKSHLRHLAYTIPALIIFLLPFGLFLLPVLAEIMDRRDKPRNKEPKTPG
jgi:hypothetical protein